MKQGGSFIQSSGKEIAESCIITTVIYSIFILFPLIYSGYYFNIIFLETFIVSFVSLENDLYYVIIRNNDLLVADLYLYISREERVTVFGKQEYYLLTLPTNNWESNDGNLMRQFFFACFACLT